LPIGLESVDRNENVFVTYTPGFIYLLPTNVIGTKIYFGSDTWSLDVGAVNNFNGPITGNSAVPSGFLRVGANWGEEDNKSSVNIGGGIGPELNTAVNGTQNNSDLDYLGDLWGQIAVGDVMDIGFEGIYRQTQDTTGANDQQAYGGQLFLAWGASDIWSVQLRYAGFFEQDGVTPTGASTTGSTFSGYEGWTHTGTLGASYHISDEAKLKLEYRFDYSEVAFASNASYHTGVAEFAYSF
jgi:hypothetical protein